MGAARVEYLEGAFPVGMPRWCERGLSTQKRRLPVDMPGWRKRGFSVQKGRYLGACRAGASMLNIQKKQVKYSDEVGGCGPFESRDTHGSNVQKRSPPVST